MQQQATAYPSADTNLHSRQVYTSAQDLSEEEVGGAIVGSLVGLTIVVLVLVWCRYRHKVRNHTRQRSRSLNRSRTRKSRHRGQIDLPNLSSSSSATPLPVVPPRLTVSPPPQSVHLEPRILQHPQCTRVSTISAMPSPLPTDQHPIAPLPLHVAQGTFPTDTHQLRPGEFHAEGSASTRTTNLKVRDQKCLTQGQELRTAMRVPTTSSQPVLRATEADHDQDFVPKRLTVSLSLL
jgi:hypothetical protein